eukprot:TRINITY_DN58863_c0_g1_i1.p1 TRINITY_DN58863_c0_g1~~TRINITY_DN58863_c0_g1_i1.p1  ORF type:complete len:105 (+),score=9.72 TRINITY_DN58863_c0_g1_i1:234-548(+)
MLPPDTIAATYMLLELRRILIQNDTNDDGCAGGHCSGTNQRFYIAKPANRAVIMMPRVRTHAAAKAHTVYTAGQQSARSYVFENLPVSCDSRVPGSPQTPSLQQ